NKRWQDVIYREQLAALRARHPDRLRVVHTLTRERRGRTVAAEIRGGRVDLTLLRELIPDPSACLVFACGPGISPWERARARAEGREPLPRFLESVLGCLRQLGVPDRQVRREAYG